MAVASEGVRGLLGIHCPRSSRMIVQNAVTWELTEEILVVQNLAEGVVH